MLNLEKVKTGFEAAKERGTDNKGCGIYYDRLLETKEKEVAPYGRCKVCGKVCPFDHDVPDDELVCDMCAGNDEVDW